MSRSPVFRPTLCFGESQPRRSARIQQQRQQSSVNPLRRERTSDNAKAANEVVTKKKRKNEDTDKDEKQKNRSSKLRSLQPNTISKDEPSNKGDQTVPVKRGVRFGNDDALEPLPDDKADEEAVARAAAAAITVEFLATRPENAQYASLDPRVFPCPSGARARFAPTRTLDSKGRVLLQYPIRYILAYRIEVGALYTYLKSVKRDFHDFQGTLLHFQLQLDEGLNMQRQDGMTEMVYMGRRIWSMIMSQSDRPETLPYPTARIQKFQEIMGCKCEPLIYPFRPRAHCLRAQAK